MVVETKPDAVLEHGRLRVVIATIVINVAGVSLLTFAPWSDWRTGVALNLIDNCLLIGFVTLKRDALLARFLLFGLVVGFAELPADAWLVDYTRTLDYSIGGGPMTGLDAVCVGSCSGAVRIYRTTIVGTLQPNGPAHDRPARRDQYSVL
jgi:hypothetical protein